MQYSVYVFELNRKFQIKTGADYDAIFVTFKLDLQILCV